MRFFRFISASSLFGRRGLFFASAILSALCFASPSVAEASYYQQGTVLSTNMLSGATSVTAISGVAVTTTLPANTTVKIKYSQDNVHFFNAAGAIEGWDTCAAGTNTIDISSLGWSTSIFYYKLELSTTDQAATPIVSDVQVNYTGTAVPAPSATRYQMQGTMLSTNVLSGTDNVTAISSVAVTTTLPGGATVKIKYSQDNVNFYNAAGVEEGWDTCAAGTNTIDISGLGWTGGILYYKLQWTTIDQATTPVVSDVQVDYTGDVALPPDGNIYHAQGTVVSSDLMVGMTKAMRGTEYFAYSIRSLPGGSSIKAQFSQDGTTWYSSSGTLGGQDTLLSGVHMKDETALSLAGLNWADGTHFYYKLQFSTVDSARSPILTYAGLIFAQGADLQAAGNTGLVGYWSFEDGRGTQATDFSPAGNNTGTLTGGPTWTDGKMGKAISFNGTTQYVHIGASDVSSPCTMSAWVNLSSRSSIAAGLISNADGSSGFRAEQYSSDAVGMTGGGDLVFSPSYVVPLNTWTHLVAVVNSSSSATLYVNGASSGTISSGALVCGRDSIGVNGGGFLHGSIDEVRIYNRTLSATEITDLYGESAHATINDSRNSILTNGLVGQWSFNGPDVSGTTAYDRSGQGNNGTLTNGPTAIPGKIGQALNFWPNGADTNAYVTMGNASVLDFTTGDFSVSVWAKTSGYVSQGSWHNTFLSKQNMSACGPGYSLVIQSTNKPSFSINDAGCVHSAFVAHTVSINDNQWHLITGVKSGTTLNIAVDGVFASPVSTATVGSISNTRPFALGTDGLLDIVRNINGSIDEVRVYNRALSLSEINDLYLMGR